jgi:hypothetical protein
MTFLVTLRVHNKESLLLCYYPAKTKVNEVEQIFYFVKEYFEFFKNGHFSLEYNVQAYYSNTMPSGKTVEVFIEISPNKGGLAILAMRHWSQGPLQSPIHNAKKRAFWRNLRSFLNLFVWVVAESFGPPLSPKVLNQDLIRREFCNV